MSKVLVIGCGGVASVAIRKCCQVSEVFTELCIASRTKSKCDQLAADLAGKTATKITTAQVDADKVEEETAAYEPIPLITDFRNDTPDKSKMKAAIQFNYNQVKQDVKDIVAKELDRIRRDPALRHLLRIK